jgi:sulfatase modifying factor 1
LLLVTPPTEPERMAIQPKPACCTPTFDDAKTVSPEPSSVSRASYPVKQSLINLGDPEFLMGDAFDEGYTGDGEGPQRLVRCSSFRISPHTVSNREFGQFIEETGYTTYAERFGWSFVFYDCLPLESRRGLQSPDDTPWWLRVDGATWSTPEGPGSNINTRMDHPVTHISWFDASEYCHWTGARLPTEAEWEYAARGGLVGQRYAWGNELTPDGQHRCNIWQGSFPDYNSAADGYRATASVTAFEPNGYGLYNVCGNVWEWCKDWFTPNYHHVTRAENPIYMVASGNRSMRGGSFLCHDSYCNRYRVAARSSNSPDATTNHCGFRVVVDLQTD